MQTRKSTYAKVNYILSVLLLAGLIFYGWGYLEYCGDMQHYSGFLEFFFDFVDRAILTVVSISVVVVFCICVSIQVLLTALSMGRRDKYTDVDYGSIVEFNYVVLVLYAIYMIGVPIVAVVLIVT